MFAAHMTVRIAAESDHSASTNPTTIMTTPPLWAWVVRARLDPSSVTALFGITEDRWLMIVCTACGPASRLEPAQSDQQG
jgi:hypothetical protein